MDTIDALQLKEIALTKREQLLGNFKKKEGLTVEAKIAEQEQLRQVATRIWEITVKPAILDYVKYTAERYGEHILFWNVSLQHGRIINLHVIGKGGCLELTYMVAKRQLELGYIKEILQRVMRIGYKYFSQDNGFIIHKHTFTSQSKDWYFELDPNNEEILSLIKSHKPVNKIEQENQALKFAEDKVCAITNFIEKAAEKGAGSVNLIYSKKTDKIAISTSHIIGDSDNLVKVFDTFDELDIHDQDNPKITMIKQIMEYWLNYYKNNSLKVDLLPISYQLFPINYGIQISIYTQEDIQRRLCDFIIR